MIVYTVCMIQMFRKANGHGLRRTCACPSVVHGDYACASSGSCLGTTEAPEAVFVGLARLDLGTRLSQVTGWTHCMAGEKAIDCLQWFLDDVYTVLLAARRAMRLTQSFTWASAGPEQNGADVHAGHSSCVTWQRTSGRLLWHVATRGVKTLLVAD